MTREFIQVLVACPELAQLRMKFPSECFRYPEIALNKSQNASEVVVVVANVTCPACEPR
jgi:hypothetical protein